MWLIDPTFPSAALTVFFSICAVALIIEAIAGYPVWLFRAIGHPVSWIGALIGKLDSSLNREGETAGRRRVAGFVALALLLVLCGLGSGAVVAVLKAILPQAIAIPALSLLASTCLAQRSLDAHVRAVADALERDQLVCARHAVAQIVGRETGDLDEAGVARAAMESLAENFADGVVAPVFWLALLGLPGGVLYKAINTADSMIGHRSPRHAAFGFAAAKLDDAVNWVPARLAALWLVIAAIMFRDTSMTAAWRIMRRDAKGHASPNAGWPEAAMAGALGVTLGGPRAYGGRRVEDSLIGDGTRPADAAAIRAALRIYRAACGIEIAAVCLLACVIWQWR